MRRWFATALLAVGLSFGALPTITPYVSSAAKVGDFQSANRVLRQYRAKNGVTPDYLEAYSWVARGELLAKNYQAALETAADVRQLSVKMLAGRKLDVDAALPTALGASIEVTGQALAGEGRRDEGVSFLRGEMTKWRATSIGARIQKNINLLSLEGKPAPVLDVARGAVGPKPRPLAAHAGHPVLLFFWAHWCPDCKAEVDVIQKLQVAMKLDVIAPTQRYGYVAGGEDAAPAVENPYIAKVFGEYYAGLGAVETPLSAANFVSYGVSTTPTLVLLDGKGVVRLYHPGAMTYGELDRAVRQIASR